MSERRKTPSQLGARSEITWASNVNRTWRIALSCAGWTASGSQSRSRSRRGRRRTRRAPTCEGCSPGGPVSCPATCWCPGWAGASLRQSSAGILRQDWSLGSASPAAWKSGREQSRSVMWESCMSIFFSLFLCVQSNPPAGNHAVLVLPVVVFLVQGCSLLWFDSRKLREDSKLLTVDSKLMLGEVSAEMGKCETEVLEAP